jgi:ParB family chromosome partitioning protein
MKNLSMVDNPEKLTLNNSGTVTLSRLISLSEITLQDEFKNLFPIIPDNLAKIAARMRESGYDNSQPIHLWDKDGILVLIDGHHRLLAVQEAGIDEIPSYIHTFTNLDEALEYALSLQTERRNLSDAELLSVLKVVDQIKLRGQRDRSQKGKSAEKTADILGISTSKVEKARIVEKYASPELKEKVTCGELSLNQAYTRLREVKNNPEGTRDVPEQKTADISADISVEEQMVVRIAKVLFDAKEVRALTVLIKHFFRNKKKDLFLSLLPQEITEAYYEQQK